MHVSWCQALSVVVETFKSIIHFMTPPFVDRSYPLLQAANSLNHFCVSPRMGCLQYRTKNKNSCAIFSSSIVNNVGLSSTGSDDARAPPFPSHALGSRKDTPQNAGGIYSHQRASPSRELSPSSGGQRLGTIAEQSFVSETSRLLCEKLSVVL